MPEPARWFAAVAALREHESFPEIIAALSRAVVNETLNFVNDTPYAPR